MPRKAQGWITFQSSEEERQLLEQHCQQLQRSKTEVLRELVRSLDRQSSQPPTQPETQEQSEPDKIELLSQTKDKAVRVSARNILKGTVTRIVPGAVNTEVTIEIAPGVEVTSIITSTSAEELALAEGKAAYAVIKASNVMLAVD